MRLEGIRLGERGRGREGGWRDEAGGGCADAGLSRVLR